VTEALVDDLEASAYVRARDGYEVPVFHNGEEVGTVQKYETALTIFMLKKLRKDPFNAPEGDMGDGRSGAAEAAEALLRFMRAAARTVPDEAPEGGGE
jgi:hypothetical protein